MTFNQELFPKSLKIKKTFVTSYKDHERIVTPYFFIYINVEADEVNKGKNETGYKRLTRFLQLCKKHYQTIDLQFDQQFFNETIDLPEALTNAIK